MSQQIDVEVLIVEDSATQALALKTSLESQNMKVRVAKDGLEAIDELHRALPQVIVSDIAMPRMNGFELCRQVNLDPNTKDIPVILLTNLADPMDVIRGIASGADSFLTKPCDTNFLVSTIQDVIQNKQTRQDKNHGQPLAFFFNGQHHVLQINQVQITNLLLSTYLNAVQKNNELEESVHKLNLALEEIKKKNDQLETLGQQKNQFLGMAAHDLRDPLGIIIGYSNMLKTRLEKSSDENTLKMLDKINKSSAFMLHLINGLLNVAAVESGTVALHISDVDLSELVKENLIFLNNLAEKKSIILKYAGKDSIPKIRCDATKVSQVLNNVVANAIKMSKYGGTIEVSVTNTDKEATISVKDFGVTLAPETVKQNFAPPTMSTASPDLGLAIAFKIVSEHKGKLWVTSEAGEGTIYFVSLPR